MLNYSIYSSQNDLNYNKKMMQKIDTKKINIIEKRKKNYLYKTIYFNEIDNKLQKVLIKEIKNYLSKTLDKEKHILIVGMGNEYHTADSIGPNTLKHIKVNAYLENLGLKIKKVKVSKLKPGVLGETGILSEKTILSVVNEIKPNLVILIDSFVSNNINDLNHTIELNNYGLNSGIGIKGLSSSINQDFLQIPVLAIGVTTSLLITLKKKERKTFYLLSTKDIDEYIIKLSELLGNSINLAIDSLN